MLELRTLTGIAVDSLIRVKVRAQNLKGYGAYSEVNSAGQTIENIPSIMSSPTVTTSAVTTTSIPLTWTAPSGVSAGGSAVSISSYDLQSSTDGTNWSPLATALTTTSYTHTITAGSTTYYYRIRATNKYGTQTTYSAATSGIVGTSVPAQPTKPTIGEEGTSVSVTWDSVDGNYDTVTSYKVFIITSTGSYVENTLVCDGS